MSKKLGHVSQLVCFQAMNRGILRLKRRQEGIIPTIVQETKATCNQAVVTKKRPLL
jgi:hypothetical protein